MICIISLLWLVNHYNRRITATFNTNSFDTKFPYFIVYIERGSRYFYILTRLQKCRGVVQLIEEELLVLLPQHISRERAILNRMRTLARVARTDFSQIPFFCKRPIFTVIRLITWWRESKHMMTASKRKYDFHQTLLTKDARKRVSYQKENLNREKFNAKSLKHHKNNLINNCFVICVLTKCVKVSLQKRQLRHFREIWQKN